ncbi:MAG TPA: nodulation protein NfeD [Methylomirabilota bacterium]|nr:nodulation protein NfeD [Methylomirabilota bacterium]
MSLGVAGLIAPVPARAAAGEVHVLTFEGVINPISARYIERGIREAEEEGAAAVLIELNTPGGLLGATQEITSAMLGADVPVIVYVTPPGGGAVSAGTFITMAAHVAAMAPSTRIGVATPVSGDGAEIPEDLRNKIINDTVTYARIIADERGRNADWAEEAVRDAVGANATDAVELGVVDLVARDRAELLDEIDGRSVTLASGDVRLETAGAALDERMMSPFEDLLVAISDPNIALLLLSLGSLGIYFELSAPGSFFPGIAGAIALILGLFSLGSLPINYAGLALLLLGLALMGAEIWVASGGVLGIGGAIAFLLGGLLLIDDTQAPFLEVSRPLIYGITLALVAFSLVAVRAVMRSRNRPVSISGTDMIGRTGVLRGTSSVYVEGELWEARSVSGEPTPGKRARVIAREGMTLIVEPLDEAAAEQPSETKES